MSSYSKFGFRSFLSFPALGTPLSLYHQRKSNADNTPKKYLSRTFVADAVDIIKPAVVQINCRTGAFTASSGSGFIVTPDGYIVTNAHVVANANQVSVLLSNSKTKIARVHAVDR